MSLGRSALAAYGLAGRAASLFAPRYLAARARRGKEDPARLNEKRGHPSCPRPKDRPVWIHGVSVGETGVALTLAAALAARGHTVLVTSATPASAARAATSPFTHQYAPLDAPPFVDRFLDHWQPLGAVFVEGEIWPTTLRALSRRQIPRVHVNARLSDRSFRRWQKAPVLARPLFSLIQNALCQTQTDAARFRTLGAERATATGNIKFDAPPPPSDPAALAALQAAVGGRPVWVAASVHPGEVVPVVAAHRALVAARPDWVTIAVPRHMPTADLLEAEAGQGRVARRSLGGTIADGTVYIADTMGEMGTFLSAAPIVFVGGSLANLGGHNPAEPAAFGAALLTGPSHGPMFVPFLEAGAATVVEDGAALAAAVARLMANPDARLRAGAAAKATLAANRGALRRTLAALDERLAPPAAP